MKKWGKNQNIMGFLIQNHVNKIKIIEFELFFHHKSLYFFYYVIGVKKEIVHLKKVKLRKKSFFLKII